MNRPWPEAANGKPVALYSCPSDGNASVKPSSDMPNGRSCFSSNYLGLFSGLCDGDTERPTPPGGQAAVFRYHTGIRTKEIADGLSKTAAFGEYLTGVDSSDARGGPWTNRAGSQFLYMTLGPNSTAPDVSIAHPQFCPTSGSRNSPIQNLPCTQGNNQSAHASPRSRHRGGVTMVLCDGSVRFVDDGIALAPWRNLGWMNDRQVDSAF